jgi:MYXO-CTERM domain-containing protein
MALATGGALALAAWAPPAFAFCRITTIESRADGEDLTACYDTTHPPVWWRSACVGLSVQASGSEYASYDVVADLLFQTVLPNWTRADCPGGGHPSIELADLGPVTCDERQANLYGPNTNSVLFHDYAWPYEGDVGCKPGECCDATIALTTVTFHPDTGELWDADIEINSACHPVSTVLPVPPDRFDLQSILQHETGHFLGLAHPPDPEAIMYYLYTPGTDGKRTLDSDDIDGVCAIYPPNGERTVTRTYVDAGVVPEGTCDSTPRNGFTSTCVSAANDQPPPMTSSSLSCQASRVPAPLPQPIFGLWAAAAVAGAVRTRRRVRR